MACANYSSWLVVCISVCMQFLGFDRGEDRTDDIHLVIYYQILSNMFYLQFCQILYHKHYPSPLEYYKGCYYALIILQYFTSFPEEDYKDYIPEQLKPYIDRIRNGHVNNLIVSYKIDINK